MSKNTCYKGEMLPSCISLRKFEDALLAIRETVALLTFSTCQTAAGTKLSPLGIARLTMRTGVKNVLSSLWYINDAEVVLLTEDFYIQKNGRN